MKILGVRPKSNAVLNHSPSVSWFISVVDVKTQTVHWGPTVLGCESDGVMVEAKHTAFESACGRKQQRALQQEMTELGAEAKNNARC